MLHIHCGTLSYIKIRIIYNGRYNSLFITRWITCSPKDINIFYENVGPYLSLKKYRLELLIDMCGIDLRKYRFDLDNFLINKKNKSELVNNIYMLNK